MNYDELIVWFKKNKREFPWRSAPSPYHVWVSEVMLQQTLAQVVVPYYQHWMALFPTIEELAKAPLDTVIKAWEGLGYYSRARNLHAGAKQIMDEFDGKIPNNEDDLRKIKGIGDYTAGAILSFAFHQKAAAVDGNVLRVICRLLASEDDISKPRTVKKIRSEVQQSLPDQEPWTAMEGLIELGAAVCQKNPKCDECPLKQSCRSYYLGCERELPIKSQKIRYEKLSRTVLVVTCGSRILLREPEKGKIMQDLYEFPYIESRLTQRKAAQFLNEQYQLNVTLKNPLPIVKHTFTRYRAELTPYMFEADKIRDIDSLKWVCRSKIETLAFSSGHKRVLHSLLFSS